MPDKGRRKELLAQYRQSPPEAGVYRIVNTRSGRVLLGSSTNLPSVRGKLDFARATNTPGALDHRLGQDLAAFGLEVFTFEVVELFEVPPEATAAQTQADLAALEALWRERQDQSLLY